MDNKVLSKKVFHTALIITPPKNKIQMIQQIRQDHDKAFKRWMPHVNLAFPFFDPADFEQAHQQLQAGLENFPSFEITLKEFNYFQHAKDCVLWLNPESENQMVQKLFQEIKKIFPALSDLEAKGHNGYQPHLTVGQFKQNQIENKKNQYQGTWEEIKFECNQIHLIRRDGQDAPFQIIHSVKQALNRINDESDLYKIHKYINQIWLFEMEFDILNQILTENVDKLFSHRQVYNFRKNQPVVNENQFQQNQRSPYTNQQQQKPSSLNISSSSSSQQDYMQKSNDSYKEVQSVPTLEKWITTIGPQRLQESLKMLKIDLSKLTKRDLEVQSYDQLQNEKKRVKNELKAYDSSFQQIFGRFPLRNEKEPMRPLYIYYKKLKQYIDKIPQGQQQQQQQQQQKFSQGNQQQQIKSQQGGQQINQNEIIRKIEDLKRIRSELREKLNSFQNDFIQTHNRKIRFHRDIAPVEHEYKMYKDIKIEIQKLENILAKK